MIDIEDFLNDVVFYPCCGLDGAPVMFLARGCSNFLYADYSIDRDRFERECRENPFKGYRCEWIRDVDPELLLGTSWQGFNGNYDLIIQQLHFENSNSFVALARFERLEGFDDEHGPEVVRLMFTKSEGIATFDAVFRRRRIAPTAQVHIRAGIGFGGNHHDYMKMLADSLVSNPAGLPEFLLYCLMGGLNRFGEIWTGDYLSTVEQYHPLKHWRYRTECNGEMGGVTLGQLINSSCSDSATDSHPLALLPKRRLGPSQGSMANG